MNLVMVLKRIPRAGVVRWFAALWLLVATAHASAQITVDVNVLPVATTTGSVSIERVELVFGNGAAQATVPVNAALKARALIRYRGNGALTGQWLVDGVPLQSFNRTLTFGDSITLSLEDIPPLPTFSSGAHDLTLRFSSPATALAVPSIRYMVESAPGAGRITLVQPTDGASIKRPRRDGLLSTAGKSALDGIVFSWLLAPGIGLPQADNHDVSYRVRVFLPGNESQPALSAEVNDKFYLMPPTLAATLATGREYQWNIQVLDPQGGVLATSQIQRFTMLPASGIELIRPAETGILRQPDSLEWRDNTKVFFDHYEIRAYLNDAALKADLYKVLQALADGDSAEMPRESPNPPLFQTTSSGKKVAVEQIAVEAGTLLRWIVLGMDAQNHLQEASEAGSLIVEPAIDSLNGLPKALHMGGFDISVDEYGSTATLAHLSGKGTTRFEHDRALRKIPIVFQDLNVELYREQVRTTTGTGVNMQTVVTETLKGRVIEGQVDQMFVNPVALDLQGYAVALKHLSLSEHANATGNARADLDVTLTGYAIDGIAPAKVSLMNVSLEPGGDFYYEKSGTQSGTISTVQPTMAGLQLQGGSLLADFSRTRNYVGRDGQPVLRDAGIFLSGGTAQLNASALFPVVQAKAIQLTFDALELKPDGYSGEFQVTGSEALLPVAPASYQVTFNGGHFSIQGGKLQAATLSLDGVAELPASVRTASGLEPSVRFTQLKANSNILETSKFELPELEWGASGGVPFRLARVAGVLRLPYLVIANVDALGLSISTCRMQSPLMYEEIAAAGTTTTVTVLPARINTALQEIVGRDVQGNLENGVDLRVRAAGVSGEIASTSRHTGKLGDFSAAITSYSMAFIDGAVTRSHLDGELVVPKPADFKLAFNNATITGSGEIIGPQIAVPTELGLNYWHAKLILPAPAAGKGKGAKIADKMAADIALSSTYLRITGAQLRFLLDANLGPAEFDDIYLLSLDIAADGKIQTSQMDSLNTRFIQMGFAADNSTALRFLPAEGNIAANNEPLIEIDGNLFFPTIGSRHITLAHTASGARADNLTPNGGGFGNPDYLRYDAANLTFHNGYAEGKGSYKEFLGTSQVSVLKTLYLGGLMMVGADVQGNYERIGLGLGADPLRAASLYASGPITIGAKLGAAVINTATDGHSTAESEVAQLVGSAAELATESDPKKRVEKIIKTVSDALALARRIHTDTGGRDDDPVGVSFGVTGIALTAASTFSKDAKRDDKKIVLAILDALDLSLGLVEKAKPNGQLLSQDTRNALAITRLVAKIARAEVDDGKISETEALGLADQTLSAAAGFSSDRGYQVVIDILKGWIDVARSATANDKAMGARLAASALKSLNHSGLVTSSEARDALVMGQSLIENVILAKDMPAPNNVISVATGLLDTAAGPDTTFGGGAGAEAVKGQLRLARRTLELFGKISGGIPYDKAGRAVQSTLHEGGNTDPAYVSIDSLVTNWVLIDSRPLVATVTELQNLIACEGKPANCSADDIAGLVAQTVTEVIATQTSDDLLAGLRRLKGIKDIAQGRGKTASFEAAFDATRQTAIVAVAQSIQTALIAQITKLTVRHEFLRLVYSYRAAEQALILLGITDGSDTMSAFLIAYKDREFQFTNDALAALQNAISAEQAKEQVGVMLGIQRQAELIGIQLNVSYGVVITAALAKLDVFRQQAEQSAQTATNSTQIDEASKTTLSLTRLAVLLGDNSDQTGPGEELEQKRVELLVAELSRALSAGSDGLEPKYVAMREALKVATRIEDADDALTFMRLFEVGIKSTRMISITNGEIAAETAALADKSIPPGYTAAQRDAKLTELAALLTQKAPSLLADGLSRLRTAEGVEFRKLARRYQMLAGFKSGALNELRSLLNGWVAEVPTVACERWRSLRDRLDNPTISPLTDSTTNTALRDLYARCAGTPPAQGPDPAKSYADARGGEMDGLSKFLKDIGERRATGQPDAYLKEELAWQIAERVRNLTRPFRNGRDAAQRTMGRVFDQTDYALRFRQASTPDRVIAGINMMSEPLLASQDIPVEAREEIRRIADGLTEFAKMGSAQKEGVDMGIDMAMTLVAAHVDEGLPRSLVGLARVGLVTARDKQKKGDYKNDTFTPIILAGAGMLLVGAESLKAIMPQAASQTAPQPLVIESIGELLEMLANLKKDAKDASPFARLEMVMAFLDKAAKMPVVGRYITPMGNPTQHLLAPDTDQQDYFTNLLLAELGAARNDNPANVPKAFKSTCPAFSLEQGVQWSGSPNADDVFICAVDVARETIMNNMKGAVDPLSAAGIAQNARTVVAGMRRETVFAKTSGDDTLSGISGQLEYRSGSFNRFDLISTFGLAGQFEVASKLSYANQVITIEQASSDSRDSGLLANLGLAKAGANRLFGNDVFSNPLKYMLVQIGGPGSCFNMTADIGMDTPLGGISTGRQAIATCFDPFAFDLKLNSRMPMSIARVDGRTHLFYKTGSGGLDMGNTIGVYPSVVGYGLFLEALTDLGFGAGVTGLEACGRAEVNAGATTPATGPAACPSDFVPDDINKPNGAGVCRKAASLGADFRAGSDYRNFYVKAKAGIGLPLGVYLGGWTYSGQQSDGGFGDFPSDRYGGFSGVTSINCGTMK